MSTVMNFNAKKIVISNDFLNKIKSQPGKKKNRQLRRCYTCRRIDHKSRHCPSAARSKAAAAAAARSSLSRGGMRADTYGRVSVFARLGSRREFREAASLSRQRELPGKQCCP